MTTNTYENTSGTLKRPLVTGVSWSAPSGITVPGSVGFTYDNAGNRMAMTDGMGNTSYEYNGLSQMTAETRQFNDTLTYAPLSGNRFRIQYSYGLSGQLANVTDPYGQGISYARDKTGRLSGMIGSSFAGVTSYMTNPQYRAWGALKHLEYGDNTAHMDQTFNNRLQPATFQLVKPGAVGGDTLIQKQYAYQADGNLKKDADQVNNYFDRSYTFDAANRMKTAMAGSATGNGLTASDSFSPYQETFFYDPFGNTTARKGRSWSTDDISYNYNIYTDVQTSAYQNDRVQNSFYTYDADGRALHTVEQTLIYDASGANIQIDGYNYQSQKAFDGSGVELKRQTRRRVALTDHNSSWAAWKTHYLIYSTVLGKTLTEASGTGGKSLTYVYADGKLFAEQAPNGTQPVVGWIQADSSGATVKSMMTGSYVNSSLIERGGETEANGMGIATEESSTDLPDPQYTTEIMVSMRLAGNEGGCVMDGEPISCFIKEAMDKYVKGIEETKNALAWEKSQQSGPWAGPDYPREPFGGSSANALSAKPKSPGKECPKDTEPRKDANGVVQCVGTGMSTVEVRIDDPKIDWSWLKESNDYGYWVNTGRLPETNSYLSMPPLRPEPAADPCGNTVDVNIFAGIFTGGVKFGQRSLVPYVGFSGGVPKIGGFSAIPCEGPPGDDIELSGQVGPILPPYTGYQRTVKLDPSRGFTQSLKDFLPYGKATNSFGPMSPQAGMSLIAPIHRFSFSNDSVLCH